MAINRPPSDITPKAFFEEWLPGEYAKLSASAAGKAPPDAVIGVALSGDGGGAWTLAMKSGALTGTAGAPATADFILSHSVDDWRAVIIGEQGGPELLPGNANPMNALLAADDTLKAALDPISGTIELNVTGFNGRTWSLKIAFKGAADPAASITVDTDTLAQMRAGTIAPPQAFFAGKIAITGDVNFAMQLGMAMMARMNQ
jgi:putative sterol carrier protein